VAARFAGAMARRESAEFSTPNASVTLINAGLARLSSPAWCWLRSGPSWFERRSAGAAALHCPAARLARAGGFVF
jgi:hypothetical protein